MFPVSFVVLFHPSRLSNLLQTIRFIERRELNLHKEYVLVCQTECENVFCNSKLINMCLKTYHKPKMTNTGVQESSGEIIILLDSDRILPPNYFTNITKTIKHNDVVSTEFLYRLHKNYTDEEIEDNLIIKYPDFRSRTNQGRKKNLFSGNTVLMKDFYLSFGGYDESFEGYGFADTDTTKTVEKTGNIIWLQKEEYHLYHRKNIFSNNESLEDFRIYTAINALKYFNKWKIPVENHTLDLIKIVQKNLDHYPDNLQKEFLKLYKPINMI